MTEPTSLEVTDAIGAAGAVAPRVSLKDVENAISGVYWLSAGEAAQSLIVDGATALTTENAVRASFDLLALDNLTLCLVVMKNGFVVVGKSAAASPENYDWEKSKTLSYEDAVRQIWPLMAFALKDRT
jgi:hypothetical protein